MSNFLRDDGTFQPVTASGTGGLAIVNNLSELTPSASTARANIAAASSGANSDITSITGVTMQDELDGEYDFPENKTKKIIPKTTFARTIKTIYAITNAGSCVITPKIGSTTLGGGAVTATTSSATVTHTTSNAMSVGDTLNFVISGTTTDCEGLGFTIGYTRSIS